MLNYDPSFEPWVDQNISQRYATFQQERPLYVVFYFLQKGVKFFEKSINLSDLLSFPPIEKTDHLLVDLVYPNSHFCSFHAIGRN